MKTERTLQPMFLIVGIALVLLGSVTTGVSAKSADYGAAALAGGQVIPADEDPKGYSLTDAAAATAHFNAGPRTPATLPEDFPFQILYTPPDNSNAFSIKTGTMFYVPVIYSTDLDSAYWSYPDVTDAAAVSAYYFDPQKLGVEHIRIVVDGKVNDLGPAYAVGAVTPGLPDGGNNYTVVAAFLTPLSKGVHSVTIAARFSGTFIINVFGGVYEFAIPYTVTVY